MGPLFNQTDIDCWNTTTIEEEGGKHSTLKREILIAHYTVCTHRCGKFLKINKSYNTIQNFGTKSYHHIMPTIGSV